MQVLRAALDARARYTGTHTEATGLLAAAVAHRLGLDHAKLADIEQVALLHDIGTICVPDYIARKRGALDRVEWQTMRRHTEFGAQIVASVSSLAHLAPAIRAGDECWDGTGHPDGLAGDQIPVASRIIQACNALYAMTSDRPYRKAMVAATALRGLRCQAGSQFDPAVISALLDEVATGDLASPTQRDTRLSILVVDDDLGLCFALQSGLATKGFTVRVAATASEAYLVAGDACFDVILLDWLLPGGDSGSISCRRLRYLHPCGPIVVLTGLSDRRDHRAAREAGAAACLQKGISLDTLAQCLHDIAQPA
jgi:response regulator RpfG family c-di-GMP phosphodiesterase